MVRPRHSRLFFLWIVLLALVLAFGVFLIYLGLTQPIFGLPGGMPM
ncbi:MAG: hypothetical protein MR842_06450 [Clostridiales bacterium]|nr:hypothetical protein [Clostridiales bacterium]MDO4350983.1 hypothetical protein [Eubacteriales bacterium]MDY4009254.1 hypothetical protein [Candidatus Limiplasma sp.]